ncbi:hypothetical protein VNI00_011833 [Paramarasmius palmivorus]
MDSVLEAMRETVRTMFTDNPQPRYHYRRGREYEFQILVNGEDYEFEVPAPLMCISSGHFSDVSQCATVDGATFDYVQINLWGYSRDVVGTVLELVYRLDRPDGIISRLLFPCLSTNTLERCSGLTHMLEVLRLANEWRMPKIKRLIQLALIADGVVPVEDFAYVRGIAEATKATILLKRCNEILGRVDGSVGVA